LNYATLVTQIQDQLEYAETTFVASIPDFVQRAEERIYRMVQIPDLKRVSTSNFVASNAFITVPTDYLSAYSLAVINGSGVLSHLLNKEYEFLQTAYPDSTVEGLPKYYSTVDDDTIQVAPTPDTTYAMELYYFYLPVSIVTDSTTWLGDNAPNALFWGSVSEGYKFMKGEPDLMEMYDNAFSEAIAELKILAEGRSRKGSYRKPDTKISI
jgi:hypothetical protein